MASTPPAAEAVAAEVRAELGKQRKTQAGLAEALEINTATAARRLDGSVPFSVVEIYRVAAWLQIPVSQLLPELGGEEQAAS